MAGGALYSHSGFFVVRMPLLPVDELGHWGEGALAPSAARDSDEALEAAVAADRERLVARLRGHVISPVIREALFVASPSLDEAVAAWLADSASAANVTTILARYFARLFPGLSNVG